MNDSEPDRRMIASRDFTTSRLAQLVLTLRCLASLAVVCGPLLFVFHLTLDPAVWWHNLIAVPSVLVAGSVTLYLAVGRSVIRELKRQTAEIEATVAGHRFTAELQNAFDMAEVESDAHTLVGRVLAMAHEGGGELLLADSSRAHLARVAVSDRAPAPGCSVTTPWSCPAVRRGQSLEFTNSSDLSACPRLAERGPGLSALCVPVTILGTPMGVIHLVDEGQPSFDRTKIESVASQAGSRIGSLRATATNQRAASTDPLTGQLNRRSLDDQLQRLAGERQPFAVAFGDLDNFKRLNDTHGHATGDRALRLFASVLASTVRSQDIVCRYGGEEFVVLLPGCSVEDAAPILHRVRGALAEVLTTARTPAFTASFGLADSSYAEDPLDVIAYADAAVLQAKAEGKDRLIIAAQVREQLRTYGDLLATSGPDWKDGAE